MERISAGNRVEIVGGEFAQCHGTPVEVSGDGFAWVRLRDSGIVVRVSTEVIELEI
jgi:hypothetical protein